MTGVPVDAAAFAVFGVQALDEAGLASTGDALAVAIFWGRERFNGEIVRRAPSRRSS